MTRTNATKCFQLFNCNQMYNAVAWRKVTSFCWVFKLNQSKNIFSTCGYFDVSASKTILLCDWPNNGETNIKLSKPNQRLCAFYNNKTISEQHNNRTT